MKVLHLINTLSVGGAEMHLLTLCRQLKRSNVEIVVACLREQVKGSRSLRLDFENEGIRVINLWADSRYNSRFLGQVARLVAQEGPEILHTHLPRADVAGAIARFLHPYSLWVSSVHGIYSNHWSGRWSLPVIRRMWERADGIICISQAVHDWLAQIPIPLAKTKVVHYGIEPDKFSQSRFNLREQWSLNGAAVIGSVGRLEPGKNHECLIAAMPQICQVVPNAILLIAGHDPWGYGSTLRRRIDELGIAGKVRLIGFQNDVASFLSALDVFAFATKSEGFGQVVVEAMAAGKPVVASKIAPLTEIVVDGECGQLVDTDSAESFAGVITSLLKNPAERARMGAAGRARVKEYFTAERMSQETLSFYENVLQRKAALRASA